DPLERHALPERHQMALGVDLARSAGGIEDASRVVVPGLAGRVDMVVGESREQGHALIMSETRHLEGLIELPAQIAPGRGLGPYHERRPRARAHRLARELEEARQDLALVLA